MTTPNDQNSILWLGAHKTGTTFLQKALELSADTVKASGLTYTPLGTFRSKWTKPLLYTQIVDEPMFPPRGPSLIFDENIPGLVQQALSRRGLYPRIAGRSEMICDYFGIKTPTIIFGVRCYADFLASLYCEVLKSNPFCRFEEFYLPRPENLHRPTRMERMLALMCPGYRQVIEPKVWHPLDWGRVLNDLVAAFPESQIKVYAYESLRGNERELLSRVIGQPADGFTLPGKEERLGFSQRAIDELNQLSTQKMLTTRDVFAAIKQYPKSREFPAFDPWSQSQKQELADLYRQDLDAIRKRDDIVFMDLGRPEAAGG